MTPAEKIIALLRESGPLSGRQIVAALGLKTAYVHLELYQMMVGGVVEVTPDIRFALPIRHP